ncbi:MAG: hypothetical protein LIO37_01360 [Clostridiales bacterium]|nr:hypothetical protein [Clostridiales bacterium]
MGHLTITDTAIYYERRNELAEISAFGRDVLRFKSSANAVLCDEDWVLLAQPEAEVKTRLGEHSATIENGRLKAEIFDNGKVVYYKKVSRLDGHSNGPDESDGFEVLLEEMTEYAFEQSYRTYRSRGSNTHLSNVLFKPYENEHFYGLGGEKNGCFDMKGTTSELQHRNTKTSIPFVYSSRGYGFIWNNPSVGRCELTKSHTKWTAYRTKQVDYLVLGGDSPAEVMGMYADLTGHTPDFPSFASGFWQSRLRYESQEDLLEVAREYKKRGIPISVIVIDYFHWTEQGDYKFDPKYWPDPAAMVRELNDMGIELVVSIWPTSNPNSENYRYMDDRNMLLRVENGIYGLQDIYGQQDYMDTINPAARDFVWSLVKKNYYGYGIHHFWLDEAEPNMIPNHYDNVRCCRGNFEEYALLYPYYYEKMFYDGLKAEGESEIISLSRAAYMGSQRFGALVWSGDVPSTFDSLEKSVRTGLAMAMSGIPWWTTDIGGFWGGDPESEEFRELLVRWFQFGVFCPVTRLHGSRVRSAGHVYRHPGIQEPSGADNEIWSYGEHTYEILRSLVELRERLRPYVDAYMKEAKETGVSIMRPLFMEYPDDPVTYTIEDEYLFGRDILFAPITAYRQTGRRVYLPKGSWIRVGRAGLSGGYGQGSAGCAGIGKEGLPEVFGLTEAADYEEGGRWVTADAQVDEFIAYVRADAGQ